MVLKQLIICLLVLVSVGCAGEPATSAKDGVAASVGPRPSGLPAQRLEFGLTNSPSDLAWMIGSGVPWKYRYQYLAGGVNTGQGWETWNSPAGAFASYYMDDSGRHAYIPVFTYYELLQSKPAQGAGEADQDYNNLNTPATMYAYYADFKLLMELAGAYAKPVVVHVEPDLWGFLEQRAAGSLADSVSAAVGSSGFPELAGFPNTVQGFAWALLRLRDTYAPNASLGTHASTWATGQDLATDTDPYLDPVAIADRTAAFLNSAGISSNRFASTWDLVVNDIDDHDAGWWEAKGKVSSRFTHWWDAKNLTYPNFTRYLSWVAELHARTARQQVMWQVPMGNEYFLTENNRCGHYQDNVAQYLLGHVGQVFQAGVIAVLFGAGDGCQTSYTDGQTDGVTNNGGLTTTDLLGWCRACNTNISTVADDDGGFLRIFVGRYYEASVP